MHGRSGQRALLSVLRYQELDAVSPSDFEQARNVRRPGRRRQAPSSGWHGFSSLREEANVNSSRCVDDQCAGGSLTYVAEGMHLATRDLDEVACCGRPRLGAYTKLKCAVENVKGFIIGWVPVRWWSGPWCN